MEWLPDPLDIIQNQSTINIGTIGHVAHGKTTLVKALSGELTTRSKDEKKINKTLKLGYANAKIYECPHCSAPKKYQAKSSEIVEEAKCQHCGEVMSLVRHISFVDCPGHEVLMATMLSGTAVMDAAILIVAADEEFPRPQTCEHLTAMSIMNMKNILVLQNKIDLATEREAKQQYQSILKYIQTSPARGSPVIPVSSQKSINIDLVLEQIVKSIPVPMRNYHASPKMVIIRSFDVNYPGTDIRNIHGGVVGGTILEGCLKIGDDIEIRPGIVRQTTDGCVCQPLRSKIVTLKAEKNDLQFAVSGGLIGVGMAIDPALCRANLLVGSVLGHPGQLPNIFIKITVSFSLFQQILGSTKASSPVGPLLVREMVLLNIGSTATCGIIDTLHLMDGKTKGYVVMSLKLPICVSIGDRIAISRRFGQQWRLIGWGKILKGTNAKIIE